MQLRWQFLIIAGCSWVLAAWGAEPSLSSTRYGAAKQLAVLANDEISESSGLAVSRRHAGIFWTHNDSGDSPRLFAFDRAGQSRGGCTLEGAAAKDWEDMASFELDGKPHLLVADTGDNARQRMTCELYLIAEPELEQRSVPLLQTIRFRYEDGPHDCEAVGVDPVQRRILLVTKVLGLQCQLFELELPETQPDRTLVAKRIANPGILLATSMDVSPDGRRAVVLPLFGPALDFIRGPRESWSESFARAGKPIGLPARNQGEAICYGRDGKSLYLTSERLPTPFWEIAVADQ